MKIRDIIGNILLTITGCGIISALILLLLGIIWSITVVGMPMGIKCFKMPLFSLLPFGKDIENDDHGMQTIGNIVWSLLSGLELGYCSVLLYV